MGEHNCYGADIQECIKKKAYELWEKAGRKQGRDLHYWLIAEQTVKGPLKNGDSKGRVSIGKYGVNK